MDVYKLWQILVGLRVLCVFIPQSGYIHPDEFFQTTEVIAGDVLSVQHQRTWEFTWADPIRSVLLPYVMCGPVLYLLRILDLATPYLVLLLPRLVITAASIIVDRCVFLLCQKQNSDGYTSLVLYATSYVSWAYMTHTFSNTVETILFAMLLVMTTGAYEDQKATRRRRLGAPSSPTTRDVVILAAILTIGTFNRPSFLVFAFVPMLFWLWNFIKSEWNMSDRMATYMYQLFTMSLTSLVISSVFVAVDTLYFHYESVRHIPKDLNKCVFEDSNKMECFGKMFTFYRSSIVNSPLNFIRYNTQSSNLAQHGLHPWFLHFVVNLPLLFGPVVFFVMWRVFKNIINILLAGSLKVNKDFHLHDIKMVSVFTFPLVVLSIFPHQEPRFLLPLVPVGFVIATQSLASFKPKWLCSTTHVKFWVLNVLAFLVYGFLHQGGVVPGISKLQEKVKDVKGESHVVFYHTYMAPEHLFLHPENADTNLFIYNLGGASFSKLEQTMDKIRASAETRKSDGWSGIWIVAPKTVVADVKQLKVKFGKVSRYWHLSFEDPPRVLKWLKRELSWSDFIGDFSLVVAEVSSWKVFSDSN